MGLQKKLELRRAKVDIASVYEVSTRPEKKTPLANLVTASELQRKLETRRAIADGFCSGALDSQSCEGPQTRGSSRLGSNSITWREIGDPVDDAHHFALVVHGAEDKRDAKAPLLQAPSAFSGFLMKETPNKLLWCLCRFQRRFVMLQAGRVFYSLPEVEVADPTQAPSNCKGSVDLLENDCTVIVQDSSTFVLKPKEDIWVSGSFTGADSGRVFVFDTADSSKTLDEWKAAFEQHIEYGRKCRGAMSKMYSYQEEDRAAKDQARAALKIQGVHWDKATRQELDVLPTLHGWGGGWSC